MGAFRSSHCNIYNRLAQSRLATELSCLCPTLEKASVFFVFYRPIYFNVSSLIVQLCVQDDRHRRYMLSTNSVTFFQFHRSPLFYFACSSFNIAPRTTSVADTSNTNRYSILSRSKQLFKRFCHYKHMRKYLPSFRSCRIYNSLDKHSLSLRVARYSLLQRIKYKLTNM